MFTRGRGFIVELQIIIVLKISITIISINYYWKRNIKIYLIKLIPKGKFLINLIRNNYLRLKTP